MIVENSRYESAELVRVTAADGVTRPTLYIAVLAVDTVLATYNYRVAREGESFDLLAFDLFGDPEMWWVLANYNPEIMDPHEIVVGAVLRIPILPAV